jgi:methylated-DNA-[protein]-cysteine S-methyltransferase
MTKELQVARVASAIDDIILVAEGATLVSLDYEAYEARLHGLLAKRYGTYRLTPAMDPAGAATRLRAYLAGDFAAFDGLAVDPGGTAFQNGVWQALRQIPVGTTESYGALAARLGRPTASRAVGYANSLNPIAIVLPCHRVVGANASLTGYAGGLERKRWLLRHEGLASA